MSTMNKAIGFSVLSLVFGVTIIAVAGDAHGGIFFFGVFLVSLTVIIWIVSIMWKIAVGTDDAIRRHF